MKKIILVLSLVFLFALASCDGGEDPQITETSTEETTTEVTTVATTEIETEFVPTEDNVLWGEGEHDEDAAVNTDVSIFWTPGKVHIYECVKEAMDSAGDKRIAVVIGYRGDEDNDPRKILPGEYTSPYFANVFFLTADEINALTVGEEDKLAVLTISQKRYDEYIDKCKNDFIPTENNSIWGDPENDNYGAIDSFGTVNFPNWENGKVYLTESLQEIMEDSEGKHIAVQVIYKAKSYEKDPRKDLSGRYAIPNKGDVFFMTADEIRQLTVESDAKLALRTISEEGAAQYLIKDNIIPYKG